jgi:hypothetical protein
MTRSAPILQEVAGRLAERPVADLRTDPVGWAYALRDAIAIAKPDLVVSHLDPELEAAALPRGEGDPVDALLDVEDLASLPPVAAAVELVRTLAGLPGYGERVAATVTAPADVAARLGGDLGAEDIEELADVVADLLAGLVEAYAAAGAATIVIVAWSDPGRDANGPLLRAAAHSRVETVPWRVGEATAGDLALVRVPAETPLDRLGLTTT